MKRLLAIPFTALVLAASGAMPAAAQTVPIASAERGSLVTVRGNVDRILDSDKFLLTDTTGSIRIYVGETVVPVAMGEDVTVTGLVDDGIGPREIYARSLTRADGSTVTFDMRDE